MSASLLIPRSLPTVERLQAEIAALLHEAQQADAAEPRFCEERLARIHAAKARREEQARAAAEAERQRRAAEQQQQQVGRHAGGRAPGPIPEVADAKARPYEGVTTPDE